MSYNSDGWNLVSAGRNNLSHRIFTYKDDDDAIATVLASGYFNDHILDLTNGVGTLSIGDIIFIKASDDQSIVMVTAITTNVTVADFIDSSSISDGQLTAAKIALAEGSIMIGNASGFGSALDLSAGGNIAIGNDTTAVALDMSGAGNIMVGDGTTAAALDLSAGGNIVIGNDTTAVVLDMSGAGNIMVGDGTTAAALDLSAGGSLLVGNATTAALVDLSAGGNVLVGNDTTAVVLDASDDTKIMVGNGTTITSVAMSNDVTMDNAGAVTIAGGAVEPAMAAITEGNVLVGNGSNVGVLLDASTTTQIMVGNGTTITSVAMSNDVAMDNAGAVTIQASAVEKSMLAATVRPSHMIVYAAEQTTAGSSATEAFTISGVLATDLAFVTLVDDGTGNVSILSVATTTDTLTVIFSADPQNDTIFTYQIVRATT
jgi:hypothetical protein